MADLDMALSLVDAAIEVGADAIKFQSFIPEKLVYADAAKATYQLRSAQGSSQLEMLKALMLPEADQATVSSYCKERGLCFLSTAFESRSASLLNDLGVPLFKIASPDITNYSLLRQMASYGKPLLLSTGMATMDEVASAIGLLLDEEAAGIVLLHCVSLYPAPPESMNLRAMQTMRDRFALAVGLSDHSDGIAIAIGAAALGACVIEKHITLDRTLPGPDHAASLQPDQFASMVTAIRRVEHALGDGIKRPVPEELQVRAVVRRGLVAAMDISAGAVITEAMLIALRPETGISPAMIDTVVGRTAASAIAAGTRLSWGHII